MKTYNENITEEINTLTKKFFGGGVNAVTKYKQKYLKRLIKNQSRSK